MVNNEEFQETVDLFLNANGQFVVIIRYHADGGMKYVWSTGDIPTLVSRFEPDRDILAELLSLIHSEDVTEFLNFISMLVYEKYSSTEFRIMLKGKLVWVECQGSLLDINKENSSNYISLVLKNSTKKYTDRKRVRYHLLLKSLMDELNDPLVFCDINEKIIYFNESFSQFLGMHDLQINGKTLRDLIPRVDETGILELPIGFGIKESAKKTTEIQLPGSETKSFVVIQRIVQNSGAEIEGRLFAFIDDKSKRSTEKNQISKGRLIEHVIGLLSLILKSTTSIVDVADMILDDLCEIIPCNDGFISRIDPKTKECIGLTLTALLAHEGLVAGVKAGKIKFPVGKNGQYPGIWGQALNNSMPVIVNNISDPKTSIIFSKPNIDLRNYFAVPLSLGSVKECLIALANAREGFSDSHIDLANFFGGFLILAIQKQQDDEQNQRVENILMGRQAELTLAGSLVEQYTRRLENNIDLARQSQIRLMEVALPVDGRIQIHSGYQPSELIGGDIFNVFGYGDIVVFYLADMAGHGIPSALLSTYVKACLDDWIMYHRLSSTSDIVENLGKMLKKQSIFKENLLTIFVGRLDLNEKTLVYTSAGHPFPLIFNGISFAKPDKKALQGAISSELPLSDYCEKRIKIKKGCRLLLYSDGLIEWLTETDEVFGTKKLIERMKETGLSYSAVHQLFEKSASFKDRDDVSFVFLDTATEYSREYYINLHEINIPVDDFNRFIETRYQRWMAFRICVCFSEVVANAVEHGNKNDKSKKIIVRVKCYAKKMLFSVIDEGKLKNFPFFGRSVIPPPEAVRGRGLIMIKKFASKMKTDIINGRLSCMFRAKHFE